MKQKIMKTLKTVVREFTDQDIEPVIEVPQDPKHGDYSTNVALVLFGNKEPNDRAQGKLAIRNQGFKSPRELAEKIKEKFTVHGSQFEVERVEVAGAGFINFWLSKGELVNNLGKIIEQREKFGTGQIFAHKKIMLEFADPNPFKEFHIGHLYSNIVGEAISRLFESQGAEVWRVCYQGDVGLHVAKALWGMIRLIDEMPEEYDDIQKKAQFLGKAYAFGAQAYETNEKNKEEINALNKKIYEKDALTLDPWEKGRSWSLEYFETIYRRLGTAFKKLYFESEVGKVGLQIVKENIGKVFGEDQRAIIFPGKTYGLHNRVFINSLGLPTYETKELGLAPTKYKDFAYDQSIIITGNEITEYFKVLLKALFLIKPDLAKKTKHIAHGMVRLPSGKMSSRTGNIVTGEWLLDEAKKQIHEKFKDIEEETAEKVAVGSVKYAFLRRSIGKDIEFSFDESISLQGNSGPYLQYTYARTQSVLHKARIPNTKLNTNWKLDIGHLKLEIEEQNVLRSLLHFPEVVDKAAREFAPHVLCTCLFDLAQKFNLFYQKHSVLSPYPRGDRKRGEGDIRRFRLLLTSAVGQTIKNGLYLLGIAAPEKM